MFGGTVDWSDFGAPPSNKKAKRNPLSPIGHHRSSTEYRPAHETPPPSSPPTAVAAIEQRSPPVLSSLWLDNYDDGTTSSVPAISKKRRKRYALPTEELAPLTFQQLDTRQQAHYQHYQHFFRRHPIVDSWLRPMIAKHKEEVSDLHSGRLLEYFLKDYLKKRPVRYYLWFDGQDAVPLSSSIAAPESPSIGSVLTASRRFDTLQELHAHALSQGQTLKPHNWLPVDLLSEYRIMIHSFRQLDFDLFRRGPKFLFNYERPDGSEGIVETAFSQLFFFTWAAGLLLDDYWLQQYGTIRDSKATDKARRKTKGGDEQVLTVVVDKKDCPSLRSYAYTLPFETTTTNSVVVEEDWTIPTAMALRCKDPRVTTRAATTLPNTSSPYENGDGTPLCCSRIDEQAVMVARNRRQPYRHWHQASVFSTEGRLPPYVVSSGVDGGHQQ